MIDVGPAVSADLGQTLLLRASDVTKTFRADGVPVPAVRGVSTGAVCLAVARW